MVAIADKDKLVRTEIAVARESIRIACPSPADPTTEPRRLKRMIPRIVRTLGVKTPLKVPRLGFSRIRDCVGVVKSEIFD